MARTGLVDQNFARTDLHDAQGDRIGYLRFDQPNASKAALAFAESAPSVDGVAFAVVQDVAGNVIHYVGMAPVDRLLALHEGKPFSLRDRNYTRRGGCTSFTAYYPGDEKRSARSASFSIPARREDGQPCMLTVRATAKITF